MKDLISQTVASVAGGLVAGYFVVIGVRIQAKRQSEAALSALEVEVNRNEETARELAARPSPGAFVAGQRNPGWLKHSVWDTQLPFVAQTVDMPTLLIVSDAYERLSVVPSMRAPAPSFPGEYNYGGWIETALREIHSKFADAAEALKNFRQRQSWRARYERVRADVRGHMRRIRFWRRSE